MLLDDEPIPASLFDFGLFFLHNATKLFAKGPRRPILSAQDEKPEVSRLWNAVFLYAENALDILRGAIRVRAAHRNVDGRL